MSNNFLTVRDLIDMGFGCRVTIWKKVKLNEFPAPIKFGNAVNSPCRWEKVEIDNHLHQLRMRSKVKQEVNYEFRKQYSSK